MLSNNDIKEQLAVVAPDATSLTPQQLIYIIVYREDAVSLKHIVSRLQAIDRSIESWLKNGVLERLNTHV